jgi:hypothetical protein
MAHFTLFLFKFKGVAISQTCQMVIHVSGISNPEWGPENRRLNEVKDMLQDKRVAHHEDHSLVGLMMTDFDSSDGRGSKRARPMRFATAWGVTVLTTPIMRHYRWSRLERLAHFRARRFLRVIFSSDSLADLSPGLG